jgi:hypothetical protein
MSSCVMQEAFLFCRFVDEETINFLGRWAPEKFMSLRTFFSGGCPLPNGLASEASLNLRFSLVKRLFVG